MRGLQRRCTPHQPVQAVNGRHARGARRGLKHNIGACGVVQPGAINPAGRQPGLGQYLGGLLLRHAGHTQQITQHAQHLPRRAGLPQGRHHRMKALHPTFGVNKTARSLGKRRHGQQHVGHVHVGLKSVERDHHIGLPQGVPRTGGGIALGFNVQQQHRFGLPGQDLCGVEAIGLRLRAHELRPHGVGCLG